MGDVMRDFFKKYPNAVRSKFVRLKIVNNKGKVIKTVPAIFNGTIYINALNWKFKLNHDLAKYLDLEKWRKGVKMMENFKKKYPNADMSKFLFDPLYDQPNKDPVIKFYLDIRGHFYDIDGSEFKNNPEWKKYLVPKTGEEAMANFRRKYPYADKRRFFAHVAGSTIRIKFIVTMSKSVFIDSDEFKNEPQWAQYLEINKPLYIRLIIHANPLWPKLGDGKCGVWEV